MAAISDRSHTQMRDIQQSGPCGFTRRAILALPAAMLLAVGPRAWAQGGIGLPPPPEPRRLVASLRLMNEYFPRMLVMYPALKKVADHLNRLGPGGVMAGAAATVAAGYAVNFALNLAMRMLPPQVQVAIDIAKQVSSITGIPLPTPRRIADAFLDRLTNLILFGQASMDDYEAAMAAIELEPYLQKFGLDENSYMIAATQVWAGYTWMLRQQVGSLSSETEMQIGRDLLDGYQMVEYLDRADDPPQVDWPPAKVQAAAAHARAAAATLAPHRSELDQLAANVNALIKLAS